MHPDMKMNQIVEGKRYNTETATLVCGDDYHDGHNWERHGTNTFLFRTPNGRYFFQRLTQWQGQSDHLSPCDVGEAMDFYEACQTNGVCRMEFEEAFPKITVEEA